MINRRNFLTAAGAVAAAPAAGGKRKSSAGPPGAGSPARVTTPNGRSLAWTLRDGVKEFHLVAQECEHEFAPGSRVHAWGYNGTTPGPTLEAVEGDRIRILVTNRLAEHTTIHWHGILLPNGMDGVGGLTQPHIPPGETYAYEFRLRQNGTYMYHPHSDDMVQVALGMMGLFVVHPREAEPAPADRDFAMLLHSWALPAGAARPDPSVMTDFDLWTFNSKVFPATAPLVVRTGQRVRIRIGNLSMHEHPIHLHGYRFHVTGGDGGRWPQALWRPEVTETIGVGQTRDLEFVADEPGDWALHCHKLHHTMNKMGHGVPNPIGVRQKDLEAQVRELLPGYAAMGEAGMSEHQEHTDAGHPGPANTLPMEAGQGPFGNLEMGGMFTVLKVRDRVPAGYPDPGWYRHPRGTVAQRVR